MTFQIPLQLLCDDRRSMEHRAASPHFLLEEIMERFVVCASKDEDIRVLGFNGGKVCAENFSGLRLLDPPLLNEWHKERACLTHYSYILPECRKLFDVCSRSNGAARSHHSNTSTPRSLHSFLCKRSNDAENIERATSLRPKLGEPFLLENAEGSRGGRVTGKDNQRATLIKEVRAAFFRCLGNHCAGTIPIGGLCVIPKVRHGEIGEAFAHRCKNIQSANTRIEDAEHADKV